MLPGATAMRLRRGPPRLPSASNQTIADMACSSAYGRCRMEPSYRTLVGIGLILLLIVAWAALVASLARIVGGWPVILQAPYYLVMGLAWIVPVKPLVRWMQTGSFRAPR